MQLLEYVVFMLLVTAAALTNNINQLANENAYQIDCSITQKCFLFFYDRKHLFYIRTNSLQSKSPRSRALTNNSAVATFVASGIL